ncbi:hypothetical protein AB0M36_09640 [Actinoplanes sp. NPDC051346]|uniref:hypothetical protein n=1 Tax=Actinoplanes sp. NPDC051346 TaxID=3155048 RepID=UPI00343D82BC
MRRESAVGRGRGESRWVGVFMSLTGIPLLVVAGFVAVVSAAMTILLWSRFGRWRFVVRTLGVLVTEVLVVLCVGLVANRSEQFYPSWSALAGDTGTETATAPTLVGELDGTLAGRSTTTWEPPDLKSWRLAATPTVTVPSEYSPAYPAADSRPYPVLVVLGASGVVADPVPGVVMVTLIPTRATNAQALRTLLPSLRRAFRVTSDRWALVAGAGEVTLAGRLVRALPTQFSAMALVQNAPKPFTAALGHTPAGTAVAVVGPVKPSGSSPKLPSTVTVLTTAAPKAWRTAITWTTAHLSPPLAPPLVLPTGKTE